MKTHFIILMFYISIFSSCHFHDNRVKIFNNSEIEILFAISLLNPTERDHIPSPFYPVESQERSTIHLIKNINYEYANCDSTSILQITTEMEESVIWNNGYYGYEKLLKDKSYNYLNIAIKDIIERNGLTIEYNENNFITP